MPSTRSILVVLVSSAAFTLLTIALTVMLGASETHERPSVSASDAGAASHTPFVAFARDFRGFTSWTRHRVEGAMLPIGVADGPTYIYANGAPPENARRWPIGTILVKVIESGESTREWTIHAMVKRGVPYNRSGAVGWEYFELRMADVEADPTLVWRGPGPPSGHGYAARGRDAGTSEIALVCNDCHGAGWQQDGVLTPALALRR